MIGEALQTLNSWAAEIALPPRTLHLPGSVRLSGDNEQGREPAGDEV